MRRLFLILGFLSIGLMVFSISGELTKDGNNFDLKIFKNEWRSSAVMKLESNFGNIPLYFIPNRGQVGEEALFYAKASRYTLWLTKEGLVFDSTNEKYERDVSRLQFLNSNKNNEVLACELSEYRASYFVGNDPLQWQTDIPTSGAVLYREIYKNIDLKVYGVEKQIEYDWMVKPGGKPEDIRFTYQNIEGTRIDSEGNLVIEGKFGELKHQKPISYQVIGDNRIDVEVGFKKMGKDEYGFSVKEYNPAYDLIIDPLILVYSTYLGGSGAESSNAIAMDKSGSVYITGSTTSTDFPTKNAYQKAYGGGEYDVFVTKLSPSGKSLIYSTYWGGSDNEDATGIAVDSSGAAYVTGNTWSPDMPLKNAYQGTSAGGGDYFVTKLSPNGKSLIYSTYLYGKNYHYDSPSGIAVDSKGAAYIAGSTRTYGGKSDVFVTKLSPSGKSLIYHKYWGGSDDDSAEGIAVDKNGAAYVTGNTDSTDFPIKNAYQGTSAGAGDAFVTKLSPSGNSFVYSTYLGGTWWDEPYGLAVDKNGNAYVVGETGSGNFPVKNAFQKKYGGGFQDAFITKLSASGKSLIYSTYLGGSGQEGAKGIAVDSRGAAYVTGFTYYSDNFPTKNPFQKRSNGEFDTFVTKFSPSGKTIVYSTYLGGISTDWGSGIAVDSNGAAYIVGYTESTNFPAKNAFQKALHGYQDAFVTKFSFTSKSSNLNEK
jgi:hypothetical protein